MTDRQKLEVLIRLRDAATGEEKTALRWAAQIAEAKINRQKK